LRQVQPVVVVVVVVVVLRLLSPSFHIHKVLRPGERA
jgi:hypothetical protein